MATYNSQFQEETRKNNKNTTASIRNLEVQVGQIAQHLSLQAQSTLPSSTVINPKNQENVNVVTTRIKKRSESEKDDETDDNMVIEVDLEVRETEKTTKEVVTLVEPNEEKIKKEVKPMIKKFMKDVIAKKKPTGDEQKGVTEKCERISPERRIPIKKKDPGAVAIPCTINDINFPKVLIDSGASVSLMPLSIFKKLGIGTVRKKGTKLKFAEHTIKQAYGVAEDVLVEIDRFIFPVDFEIMDISEDEETPIILGRPFMLTSGCNIDIEIGALTLKYFDDKVTLKVSDIKKQSEGKEHQPTVDMNKLGEGMKSSTPSPEKVSATVSNKVSYEAFIPKFTPKVKARKGDKVGSDKKHKVSRNFKLHEFLVAERKGDKVWKRKYPP
ncbi:uncharacterized protein LOC131655025 [Vicia villosa]|uniref:uncharacterized protein LOC131655025 n=1 Tax=Vicia villosa TaxID=3911 RepID=UPI00273C93E2|nr:uncharacterized protein LOC131655025 [Vicia villosa]